MSKKKKSRFAGKVAADNKRQATAGNSYGYLKIPKGMSVWAPEPGKRSSFDVIPYTVTNPKHPDRNAEEGIAVPGEIWYKRPFRVHRNVGVGKEAVVCLTSFGKKCPICEYRSIQQKAGMAKDELKAFNSTLRNLYCVIPIGSKEHEAKPHILDISQFLFQEKLNEEIAENADYETYMDIEDGLTLNVRWLSSTMGGGKPFAEAGRIDFDARKKQYTEDILDEVPDLDTLLTELSYKEMETKFMEMEGEAELTEEEDDDQEDAPPARKRKVVKEEEDEDDEPAPKPKRKPVVEEDDDDEPAPKPKKKSVVVEEDDDDDQDDEPAPPARKRKPAPAPEPVKKKKPVVVEEDDEDEDDVDDPLICVACQGTGKNSRGKRCAVCGGTGIKPDLDDDDDDPDDDD